MGLAACAYGSLTRSCTQTIEPDYSVPVAGRGSAGWLSLAGTNSGVFCRTAAGASGVVSSADCPASSADASTPAPNAGASAGSSGVTDGTSAASSVVVAPPASAPPPMAGELAGAPPPPFPDAGAPALVPARIAASWSPLAHTSEPSERVVQSSCVCRRAAKKSVMPLVVSANHWVRRVKRDAKKRPELRDIRMHLGRLREQRGMRRRQRCVQNQQSQATMS